MYKLCMLNNNKNVQICSSITTTLTKIKMENIKIKTIKILEKSICV